MSSASSGRYQSRLFNFFHRQSRQLKQQSDRALGNLRVAATWVATVGLYPLYLLFQSTSSGTRQVNQAVQQSLPQLPANNLDYLDPPSTDTPIQRVLLAVDTLSSEYAIVTSLQDKKPINLLAFFASWRFKFFSNSLHTSSLTQPEQSPSLTYNHPNIQGIATQLSSRTLVLITAQNQILDIFTHRQQKRLQERIIDEVASYWRSIQRREARGAGEQRSRGVEEQRLEGEERIYPFRLLAIVDRTVARLEAKHLAPVARHEVSTLSANLSKRAWNLVQQVQKISVSLSGQPVGSKTSAIATHKTEIRLNNFESYKFRLQTLIFAAINYFFGSHNSKQALALGRGLSPIATSSKTNSTQAKLRNQRTFKLPTATPVARDPWLTLDDLFGEPELPGGSTLEQQNALTLKQLAGNTNVIPSNLTRHSLKNLRDRFLKLPPSKQLSKRVLGQKTTKGRRGKLESKQLSLPTSAKYASASQISDQRSTQNTQVEAKPDWIETNATTIGYIKHPLEKILEWLDRIILWLEEMLVRVLGQVQRLWQGK